MLKYSEVIDLREKLANGEIDLDSAKELLWGNYKEGKRSWHTKDWKERRARVIKDKCEICNSEETLTLQHLSHPKKYNEYEKEVTRKYTKSFIDSNDIIDQHEFTEHLASRYDYEPIPLCPNCECRYPNKRIRKVPRYLCTSCRHEFETPSYLSVDELIAIFYDDNEAIELRDKCFVSKDKWRNQHNLLNVKYWLQREKAKARGSEKIYKEALILYLDATIKYLSFEDTISACKRCAFNFDLNNMELCPSCKKSYKGVEYATCIQCLPEEKRKMAIEKIEYGRSMRQMHRKFGID